MVDLSFKKYKNTQSNHENEEIKSYIKNLDNLQINPMEGMHWPCNLTLPKAFNFGDGVPNSTNILQNKPKEETHTHTHTV